ncbi:MAG: C10 family peptidase [Sedimentisphaerales bacterium]|nr:C10 family peptidase [Sedimentisphaerales bacterium]
MLLLAVFVGNASAQPITVQQAKKAVLGWLNTDAPSFQRRIDGGRPENLLLFTDDAGEPIYYIIHLKPSGFVIVSADDQVEPIIGFADDGNYDPSPDNPLGALTTNDLNGRMAAVRTGEHLRTESKRERALRAKKKWDRFIQLNAASDEGFTLTDPMDTVTGQSVAAISDMRVPPLLGSKWGQNGVCDAFCFDYYTPGNYLAGCVAVTMAQIMRYHQHPTAGIGIEGFWIKKDNSDWYGAYTRGGDGRGGPYYWDYMVLVPTCSITTNQRKAIGALCYDAAISVNTIFRSDSSQADTLRAKDALVETFMYAGAITGYNGGDNIGDGLIGMINPNLDAKDPVIIGIQGAGGHAVVCDGYGYNASTLYHHLNMGWRGVCDAWYNLPNIDSTPSYTSIHKCIYNIRPHSGGGEIVSGRIYSPSGEPIANPTVYAKPAAGGLNVNAESDENGIYAFDNLVSAATYRIYVSEEGYTFLPKNITTGTSRDDSAVSGNVGGVDFYGQYATDALIGRWKLDETTGQTAEDSAGVNDGTVYGGAAWQASGGMFDGALLFGGDDYIVIPNESNFDMDEQITVASWVKINTVNKDWQTVIAKGNSAWRLSTLRSERKFYFAITGSPSNAAVNGSVNVPLGEWHHVCGTYDGTHIRLYIDGVEDPAGPAAYAGGIATNNFDVYIGENAEIRGRYWRGSIDEVRIYNYALKAGEVANLMCLVPIAADVNHDCVADMADYAMLTRAYLSRPGNPRWNPDCDISSPADNIVDMRDLNVLLQDWLAGD